MVQSSARIMWFAEEAFSQKTITVVQPAAWATSPITLQLIAASESYCKFKTNKTFVRIRPLRQFGQFPRLYTVQNCPKTSACRRSEQNFYENTECR